MRIVHVAAVGPFGGLESMLATLAAGQTRRGHAVRVALILDREPIPHPFEAVLASAGVDAVPLRLPARSYARERRELAQLLRAASPDVLHTHGYRADVQAGGVGRRLGIPTLSTVHGFTGGDWKNRLYEWLQLRALRRAEAAVVVSRPLVERLRAARVPDARVHLLPNAWGGGAGPALSREQARRELGLPDDRFIVGWVGRLSFEKGADVIVDALARLSDPAIDVCLVGDGPERPALTSRARELGVHARVHWAGARPAAGRLFAAFDAFALSSRTEGTPMVLFEAIDAGVPVIATAVGGVPDVLGSEHAWLVPSEDPSALARAIAEARSDRVAAARRTDAARRQLDERFRLEPWLDAYDRIYRDIAPVTRAANHAAL